MELYYEVLIKYNKEIAEKTYNELLKYWVEYDDEIIKQACRFRFAFKHKKMSYMDCMGYVLSQNLNIKFLTGDKQFEGLDGVEFVK